MRGSVTAAQLVQLLGLEKSSVSRMLAKLIRAGELQEVPLSEDARYKRLELTAQGKESVSRINSYGETRVQAMGTGSRPAKHGGLWPVGLCFRTGSLPEGGTASCQR